MILKVKHYFRDIAEIFRIGVPAFLESLRDFFIGGFFE